jgi:hypothetical protein
MSLVVLAVALTAPTAAHAQTPRYAPAPPELTREVLRRHPLAPGPKPRYACAWLDLNGDRVEEAILWSPPTGDGARLFDGGNRYDGFEVYQKAGTGWKFVGGGLYARDADQIGVLKTRSGPWLDLAAYSFTFGDDKTPRGNYWFRCRHGKKGYESEAAPLPSAPTTFINRAKAPTYPL